MTFMLYLSMSYLPVQGVSDHTEIFSVLTFSIARPLGSIEQLTFIIYPSENSSGDKSSSSAGHPSGVKISFQSADNLLRVRGIETRP
jgi:hypothetical protein